VAAVALGHPFLFFLRFSLLMEIAGAGTSKQIKEKKHKILFHQIIFYKCDYIDLIRFVKTWNWFFQKSELSK